MLDLLPKRALEMISELASVQNSTFSKTFKSNLSIDLRPFHITEKRRNAPIFFSTWSEAKEHTDFTITELQLEHLTL